MVRSPFCKLSTPSQPSRSLKSQLQPTLNLLAVIVVQLFLLHAVLAGVTPPRSAIRSLGVRKPLQRRDLQTSSHRSAFPEVTKLRARATHLLPRAPRPNPFKVFLDPPASLPDLKCGQVKVNRESWWSAKIDTYLLEYPNGKTKSLSAFAAENGATNFECRAGQLCNVGQFCAPIQGRAWYVLLAAQQYTAFQKSLIDALNFAGDSAAVIGAQIVQDLTDPKAYRAFLRLHRFGMVLTIMGAVAAMACAFAFIYMPGLAGFAYVAAFSAVTAVTQTSVTMASEHEAKVAGTQDPFTEWAALVAVIKKWQSDGESGLEARMDQRAKAGVSTNEGMYGVIKQGAFFYNVSPLSTNDMKKKYENIIVARVLNHVLKDKLAFVTIGSDPCTQSGPNGAFPVSAGWWSYCDRPGGTMMNIVYADGNQTGNKWYNAHVLPDSYGKDYGVTVEYIVKQSERCFRYYGFDGNPYGTTQELPKDINSDCIMNLPVCDTRSDLFKHWLHEDNTTVMTCRALQKLPV